MGGPDDACIIGLFCILVALFVSFIAVVVGHYSVLEDSLMKEYLKNATVHEAAVLSAEFSRAATTNDPNSMCTRHEHAQSEYVANVEYNVVQKDKRRQMIRKEVKVFAADFKKASGSSSDIPHAIGITFSSNCPSIREDDFQSVFCGQEVEVLVMPGYARSGLPRSQVLRTCSLSYRMPTAGLLVFLLVAAGGCFYTGVKLLVPAAWATYQLTLEILAAVMLIEVVLVVGCWGKGMRDGVHDVYLNGGEYVKQSHDDTTISSGDDSYLRTDSYSRL
eukprot:scaffold804_cov165-Amphora_coffeaeformis.AAC.19